MAAREALARVGISEVAWQRASTLSGGQQQRAAIARTLVQRSDAVGDLRAAYSFSRLLARQSRRDENIWASQEAPCRQVRL
nr:ATP-binding cassette domain-containing protein [Mesorhizobium delmotii]